MKKKMSVKVVSLLFAFVMMFSFMPVVSLEVKAAEEGKPGVSMPTGVKVNITAVDDVELRWNVDNNAQQGSALPMGNMAGANCEFQLYEVMEGGEPTGFYGIQFKPKDDTTAGLFVDVDSASKDANTILHLWKEDDYSEYHQQFSFHMMETNPDTGLMVYYIQTRHSNRWIGYKNTTSLSEGVQLAQVNKENRQLFYVTPASDISIKRGISTITGSPQFGQTLTASLEYTNNTGTLSYEWMRGDVCVGTDSTYALTKDDIGEQLSVVISSDDNLLPRTSEKTAVVTKADTEAPAAPTLSTKTHNAITINTVTGQEYKIGTGDWQESGSFTGLESEHTYAVYTRIKETETHNISKESEALTVTTESTPIVTPVTTPKPIDPTPTPIAPTPNPIDPTPDTVDSAPVSAPKTGDDSNIMQYLMLALICLGGVGYGIYIRKISK